MAAARQLAFTVALAAVVALGAVVANLALLRSTQDAPDPVGRLSPRAVFPSPGPTTSGNGQPTAPSAGGGRHHEGGPDD